MHRAEQVWQYWREQGLFKHWLADLMRKHVPDPPYVVTTLDVQRHMMRVAGVHNMVQRDQTEIHTATVIGHSLLSYRETKQVYQITAELARELSKLKTPLKLPLKQFHIPRSSCVLDFSEYLGPDHPHALVFVSYDAEVLGELPTISADDPFFIKNPLKTHPVLKVVAFNNRNHAAMLMGIPVNLNGRSIWEAAEQETREFHSGVLRNLNDPRLDPKTRADLQDTLARLEKTLTLTADEFVKLHPIMPLVVNTFLYLQGDPDVVKTIHPGMRPPKKAKQAPNREKLARKLDTAEPNVQRIGERFTAAIKLYEIEREKLQADHATKGTKCPHLRAPHPHIYRLGPDRLDVVVKFLGWIGVKGAEVPQSLREAFAATITPVK